MSIRTHAGTHNTTSFRKRSLREESSGAECSYAESSAQESFRERFAQLGLRFYRSAVSPMLHALTPGAGCRFAPSCADYAAIAVAEWGLVRGTLFALWRLLRCHPLSRGGYDPVRPRKGSRAVSAPLHPRNQHPGRTQNPDAR